MQKGVVIALILYIAQNQTVHELAISVGMTNKEGMPLFPTLLWKSQLAPETCDPINKRIIEKLAYPGCRVGRDCLSFSPVCVPRF